MHRYFFYDKNHKKNIISNLYDYHHRSLKKKFLINNIMCFIQFHCKWVDTTKSKIYKHIIKIL